MIQSSLKKRFFKYNKIPKLKFGTVGIYCLHSFRFEYRYCLFFRKFFKRHIRRRKRKIKTQHRRRTWLFIRPNYSLSHKSKNARMGKGKGNFKR
jgi:ribosomal protein L16/L10AE